MKKVWLLNNIPAPYFDPLFARLGQAPDWALTVCYTSSWNVNAGWAERPLEAGQAHQTVILDQRRPWLTRLVGTRVSAAIVLLGMLARQRPDYVISYGYTLAPQITAILWAMARGTPFAVVGDANVYTERVTGLRRVAKSGWLRWVTRRAAALIAIGTANRMFWEAYGARPAQLFEARYAVDNDFFARAVEQRRGAAAELRARLGWADKVVFLFVGRLVKRKNVDLLIRAAGQLKDVKAAVVIAGDGEERPALAALDRDQRVVFTGAVAQDELPLYYALADALVLPARQEPWGLVINEAMAAGLAVIAHRHCGAAVDLVDSDNGVVLETFSVEELAAAMRLVVEDDARRRAMQQRSREKIRAWSIPAAARKIIQAVDESAPPRRDASVAAELRH